MNNYKCLVWEDDLVERDNNHEISLRDKLCNHNSSFYKNKDSSCDVFNPRAGGSYIASETCVRFPFYIPDSENYEGGRSLEKEERRKISGFIAQENLKGNKPDLSKIEDFNEWIKKLPEIPQPPEQADLFLKGLGKIYPNIGGDIHLHVQDIETPFLLFLSALSYLPCFQPEKEIRFIVHYLTQKDYIKKSDSELDGVAQITVDGWDRLKKINHTPNLDSKQGFVAMWFTDSENKNHEKMKELFKSIKNSIESAGFTPLRIDKKSHSNKIDDEIISEINKSRFVVCDLTSEPKQPRANVYFEAGYTLGKGIQIIWTCEENLKEDIAFHIRQYNCLFWQEGKMDEFEKNLKQRIDSIIGK